MKNLQLILDGLNCAHCGSKIEEKARKLPNVKTSSLNFINKTLTIEYDDIEDKELYNKIDQIVQKIEPGVIVDLIQDEVVNLNTCSSSENSCSCCGHHNHEQHEHDELQKNIVHKNNKGANHSHTHNHDSKDKSKLWRIIIGGIIFSIAVFGDMQENIKISLLITSYIILGYDILLKAFKNIINGQVFDENFLMALASLGALIIGEHPEAAGVMLFYQVGEYLQGKAVDNSRKSIKGLLDIKPEYANLKQENNIKKVKPEEIRIGDVIVVKPGEKVPLDGIIIDGSSSIDKSALTGESMTVDVFEGNEILSGSINLSGLLTIKVSKIYKESTVSRILYLVEKASNQKAKAENFITKFARYYTPIVVLLAAIISIAPPLMIEGATFSEWIYKGLIFLVVSCPCALVLSIPLTYFGGIGSASRQGILIKGSNYLEALSSAEIVVFDKTGTLTEGSFEVTLVKEFNDFTKDDLVKTAAYAEFYSNHPIALSIKDKYNNQIESELIKDYKEIPGYGITAVINNKHVIIGNRKIMEKEKIDMISVGGKPGTVVYLAIEKIFAGYIIINDKIKQNTENLVENLKKLGINKTVMLTGDNNITAKYVGDKLKLDEYYAELLPHEKVEIVEQLFKDKKANGKLIFIGDGINDAPVLVRSDIGIAMGGVGSDAAIEASDIVIMADEPEKVCQSIKIANKTKNIVWQNIIFAIGIKILVMILSVLGVATMPQAVFADVGVALIAVLNATRILRI